MKEEIKGGAKGERKIGKKGEGGMEGRSKRGGGGGGTGRQEQWRVLPALCYQRGRELEGQREDGRKKLKKVGMKREGRRGMGRERGGWRGGWEGGRVCEEGRKAGNAEEIKEK